VKGDKNSSLHTFTLRHKELDHCDGSEGSYQKFHEQTAIIPDMDGKYNKKH
jgi:hypothetical protein